MRKMMLVAVISLTVGGLIGIFGPGRRGDAAAAPSCPHSSIVRFMKTTLGRGAVAQVPAGCTDSLLLQLYLQSYGGSQQSQALSTSLATLATRFNTFCAQIHRVAQVSCS